MRWRAVLVMLVAVLRGQAALAQAGVPPDSTEARGGIDPRRRDDEALAYRYAPVMHFAPQEQYFPILPYFNAFLRLSDTSTYLTQELVGRMEVLGGGRDSLILWNALARDYDDLQGQDRGADWAPRVAALFYRVDHLNGTESRRIWSRMRGDFQLWRRLMLPDRIRRLAETHVDSLPRLISLEYYAYYIRDLGLTGHAQDLEKFFVFVPVDPTPVQIMVGAAHSIVTPNNTVILARKQGQVTEGSQLYTPHALVEYGGHSFSPDVPPIRSFTPGWDINWRASERTWGVRDMQAVLGTGFTGDYKTQYTLPRADSIGVTLRPWVPGTPRDSAVTTSRFRRFPPRPYALINIDTFRALFEALRSTGGDSIGRVREAWDSVLGPALRRSMNLPIRRFPMDSVEAEDVYRRLRLWLKPDLVEEARELKPDQPRKLSRLKGSATKMRPWRANEYIQAPEHIMKAWLYRPQDAARKCHFPSFDFFPIHFADLQNLEAAFRYGVGKKFSHTSLVVEATDAYHCIERASKLNVPGTLGLGVSASPMDFGQGPVEISLRYQHRYFSPQTITWSLGLSYVASFDSTETEEVRIDPSRERSRWRVRPALTIMPIGLAKGATLESNWVNLVLSSLALRVGPQIDLFHPSRSMAWQIELAVRPNPKFVPKGHRASVDPEHNGP